ncbi:S4 domain-containing protein YaaA [Bacillus norwichensis]|uniref:S4 domain-containing protein YaaA n=1 Tax=Bacillus norwichensis TaxID=2762217 RepID=A0ABR8VLD9_9BACI|nr:S4 domain-containing protein YaaA [Bacillus norwichensis]MBD8005574.1 S4 domain-containing protein YaaA [Bacillus norwichensis]
METKIKIETDTITLGQFLKLADLIQSGGMAKWFLSEHTVLVNGEQEQRRGRKLVEGDLLEITGVGSFLVVH